MLFSYPSDDMLTDITVLSEDPDLPGENGLDDDPSIPLHAVGSAADIILTSRSAVPEGLFLINPGRLNGATILFNGGSFVNLPITIPERDEGGQPTSVFVDLRAGTVADTSWTLAIGGTVEWNQIGFGRIFLAEHVRDLHVITGPKFEEQFLDVATKTVGGYNFVTPKGVLNKAVSLQTRRASELAQLKVLHRACRGRLTPFPLVPWDDEDETWWVKFTNEKFPWTETEGFNVVDIEIALEHWTGLPLDFPL